MPHTSMTTFCSPRALLLHLKRFIVEQRKCDDGSVDIAMRKNKAQVGLSKSIALDNFRGNVHSWKNVEESRYSLRSLVYHVGDRASSGHYTAHAIRSRSCDDGSDRPWEWVSFDDSKTETVDFERLTSSPFEQRNAYMLLYMLE
jgi:Ubiquitin carboxyl-terminal hydrolase